MVLSYKEFNNDGKRKNVKAKLSKMSSLSSYGQPVILLEDGEALDMMSWVMLGYRVEKASKSEINALQNMGLIEY